MVRLSVTGKHFTAIGFAIAAFSVLSSFPLHAQSLAVVDRRTGLLLEVADEYTCPTLRLLIPGGKPSRGSLLIAWPEHVTVLESGKSEPKHLYLWWPPENCKRPNWRQAGQSLEYEMDLKDNVHMLARVTLDPDGVSYLVKLTNRSDVNYERVEAIWDPRLADSFFRDVRLERTFVHRKGGWELLASDMPDRLTMPLSKWLPLRYMDDYTWPVPPPGKRVVKGSDGITRYDASQPVDVPVIAELSKDKKWLAASYTKNTGNVWTNPELTCQHANPAAPLKPWGTALLEGKTFVFRGSLDDLLRKIAPLTRISHSLWSRGA